MATPAVVVVPVRGLFLVAVLALPSAGAHPVEYVLFGGALGAKDVGAPGECVQLLGLGIGAVCFEASHIVPSGTDQSVIQVDDEVIAEVSAFYCQDLNEDMICGGEGDYASHFCTTLDLYGQASGASEINWNNAYPTVVFLDSPVAGTPLLSACPGLHISFGIKGDVNHF